MARKRTQTKRTNLPARRIGRPSALTPHTVDIIIRAVENNETVTSACAAAGIHRTTYYNWRDRAIAVDEAITQGRPYNPADVDFLDFFDKLERAHAQGASTLVGVVMKSVKGGYLTKETPLQDVDGHLVRGDDGQVMYDRVWSQPDGRLALAMLGRSRPGEWSQSQRTAGRIEVGGTPGAPGLPAGVPADQIAEMAARMSAAVEHLRSSDRRWEGNEIVEGDVLEDRTEFGPAGGGASGDEDG